MAVRGVLWGAEKDVKGGEGPGVRSGDEREAPHYPVSLMSTLV